MFQGKSLEARLSTLKLISGLPVSYRTEKNVSIFVFGYPINLMQVFTYRKAKIFAEGVALGRKLENSRGL